MNASGFGKSSEADRAKRLQKQEKEHEDNRKFVREVANAYRIGPTPGAFVVDADGGIGSEVMQGTDEIRVLVDRELWRLRPASDA